MNVGLSTEAASAELQRNDDLSYQHSSLRYELGGRVVRSVIPLPAPLANGDQRGHDWSIEFGSSTVRPPLEAFRLGLETMSQTLRGRHVGVEVTAYRDASGLWLSCDGIGAFRISPDCRRVQAWPHALADEGSLGIILTGPIASFVLYQLGVPSLHASAVEIDGGAVAFLGMAGRGKSTMAAAFVRRGFRLLADDLLTLEERADGILGGRGQSSMRVWAQTAKHTLGLEPDALPPLAASMPKKLVHLDEPLVMTRGSLRIHKIYLLDRYDPAAVGREDSEIFLVKRQDGLAALLQQASCAPFLRTTDHARNLRLFARLVTQAPIQILRFPTGFEYQDTVCARILNDLGRE